jgi:inner membrane protein
VASLGHIAVGMAAARFVRRGQPTRFHLASAMVIWSGLSMLPDADVIAFRLGIPYGAPFGHRGASHSLAFAFVVALIAALVARVGRLPAARVGLVALVVVASHGLLDTLTDGGHGVALLWPLSNARLFAPWRPIPVAPIGRAFFSHDGLEVALTEIVLFAPCILYALWPRRTPAAAP